MPLEGKSLHRSILINSLVAALLTAAICVYLLASYGLDSYVNHEKEKNSVLVHMIADRLEAYCDNRDAVAISAYDRAGWFDHVAAMVSPLSASYSLIIADDQGLPLYVSTDILAGDELLVPAFELISEHDEALLSRTWSDLLRKTVPVAWSRVSSTGWTVILYESRPLEQQAPLLVMAAMLGVFFFYMIFMTLMSLFRNRKINNSIRQLIWQTHRVAEGLTSDPVGTQPYREFTRLAESFNKMNTQLQERNDLLEQQAYTDNLTGLANRTQLMQTIMDHINSRPEEEMAVFFIDLDDFKRINDSYGHPFGDQLLVLISNRLRTLDNQFFLISRIGGDEFVLLLRGLSPVEQIRDYAEQVILLLKDTLLCANKPIKIGFSMGISLYPKDGDLAFNLLQCADMALYAAKSAGKSTYRFFDEQMRIDLDRQLYLEDALEFVVEREELQLNYQMQVLADTLTIRGFEALIRWNSRQLGYVTALKLISVAEENGKIIQIGEWIMRQACKTIAAINGRYSLNLIMSVNVSPIELRNPQYSMKLEKILQETGVRPSWLELEITEQVLIDSGNDILDILERINKLGISIALDDFGTGYSSLSYLHHLPVSTIKIDRSFITNLSPGSRDWQMVESILFMAKNLGLFTIAEGVEHKENHEQLKDLGCDCMQGFYFCRPLPEPQLFRVIAAQIKDKKPVSSTESLE